MRPRPCRLAVAISALLPAGSCSLAGAPGTVQCVWVFDRGRHTTTDLSAWTPGANAGVPWEFANHCYLIRHAQGLFLWDTGFDDAIAALPDGLELAGGTVRVRLEQTLVAQLQQIGVRPADVTHFACSHFHIDHAGNANLFAAATLYVQESEWTAAFGPAPQRFGYQPSTYRELRHARTCKLHGDHDVFGDGSVVILSTPGHTPGHQSLLVRLPRRGAVVLSGDVAHLQDNWRLRRVPATNHDPAQSRASMERIARVLEEQGAELWINHDAGQSACVPKAPARVE